MQLHNCSNKCIGRARLQKHGVAPARVPCRPLSAYSSNRYSGKPSDDQQDVVGGLLDYCISACGRVTDSVISRMADMLQSVAPPEAPRQKIEVSVKGALFLLLLALLKGVLNFVLLVGTVGLAVYTGTQVFGWNAVLLGQGTLGGNDWQQGPQQPYTQQQRQQQQQQRGRPAAAEAAGAGGWSPGYQTWQQQQQQQQQAGPWDMSPKPQGPQQGDVVDVFYGPGRPAS